ncbi:hypothetical protein ACVBEF_12300 [Glaciimonas sp. GG7]
MRYIAKKSPPVTPDAKNNQKSIVTRNKLRIDFFEEEGAIEISTPKNKACASTTRLAR